MAFLLALCSWARPALGQTVARWGVAAAPEWVEKIAPAETSSPNAGSKTDDGGQHFVLFDRQVRVERDRTESFSHWSRRITNEVGLQQSSQLVVDFDASYQTLTLHYVRVRRGDVQIDELDRGAIKLIQRESELDAQVYNGMKSAVLFLRDVRVGDVVDYAYTLSGSDPTLSGKFIAEFPLGASVVVDRVFERLLVPSARAPASSWPSTARTRT